MLTRSGVLVCGGRWLKLCHVILCWQTILCQSCSYAGTKCSTISRSKCAPVRVQQAVTIVAMSLLSCCRPAVLLACTKLLLPQGKPPARPRAEARREVRRCRAAGPLPGSVARESVPSAQDTGALSWRRHIQWRRYSPRWSNTAMPSVGRPIVMPCLWCMLGTPTESA